jgi:undecaprenyl-diphosphatase
VSSIGNTAPIARGSGITLSVPVNEWHSDKSAAPNRPGAELRPLLVLPVVPLAGFAWLARSVVAGDTVSFDRAVFLLLRRADDSTVPIGPLWLKEAARDVTALGSTIVLGFMVLAAVGYLVMARKRAAALLVFGAVVGGQLLSTTFKNMFQRVRPDLVPDAPIVFSPSFPSGHAMLSAVTYLTLGALLARVEARRPLRTYILGLAVFLTVIIGISRVYLGVHWPTDVLAGWCVGAAWATFCWCLALWLQQRGQVEPPTK